MNKVEKFAEEIMDWAITHKGQFGYSQNGDKLRRVLDKAIQIGGFASEVARTVLDTMYIGDTVARVSYKQAICIARSIHYFKEETYTVTFRFRNTGRVKTATHCDKKQLDNMLKLGLVIEYKKNL